MSKTTAFKGFDLDLKCRDHQFEIGGTYEIDGKPVICQKGFHACEHPLDVWSYYPPSGSRFAIVEAEGEIVRHENTDTKIAAARLTITAEISLHEMIGAAVKWVFDRVDWEKGTNVKADRAGSTSEDRQGAASALGKQSVALATGFYAKARAAHGSALILIHRDDDGEILNVVSAIAGRDGIKPETWYTLNDDGEMLELA